MVGVFVLFRCAPKNKLDFLSTALTRVARSRDAYFFLVSRIFKLYCNWGVRRTGVRQGLVTLVARSSHRSSDTERDGAARLNAV